ncbi:MAG: hypothetical protein Q8O15_07120, partial [Rectinemataceae bacterium]|nr:hypothetical protein [Rectinemataceae bacterium]
MRLHTHILLKRFWISLLCWFLFAGGAGIASAQFIPECIPLDLQECESIRGGDVRMVLNAERTRLTVNVIDNEYEARLGRLPPKEVYEIDVHNRVKETCEAPYMPTVKAKSQLQSQGSLKSSASPFPEGNWLVTTIKPVEGKYGPYMINTGAVGKVDVYGVGSAANGINYLGRQEDTGYAIHANTIPFEYSKSYGCIVARQDDVVKLANTLTRDRAENNNAVQTIRVR